MKTVGLDLDGVIYPWHNVIWEHLKNFRNEELGYNEFWKKAREEKYKYALLKDLVEVPMFYSQRNIRPHILNTVLEIAKNNIIYYITARPDIAKSVTQIG